MISQNYIQVEYAKSNRAKCSKCGEYIDKDQLKIGQKYREEQEIIKLRWCHLECFQLNYKFKQLKIQKIVGYSQIQQEHKPIIQNLIKDLQKELKQQKKQKQASKQKKQKEINQKQNNIDKKSYKQDQQTEFLSSSQESEYKHKSTKRRKKNKNKKIKLQGYTKQEREQFNDYCQQYLKLNCDQLRLILSKNNQSKSGNKSELIEKCADGKLLGRIPNCPECGGGKLRFDDLTGSYRCPGYMEDTNFRHCGRKFGRDEIKRQKWIQN